MSEREGERKREGVCSLVHFLKSQFNFCPPKRAPKNSCRKYFRRLTYGTCCKFSCTHQQSSCLDTCRFAYLWVIYMHFHRYLCKIHRQLPYMRRTGTLKWGYQSNDSRYFQILNWKYARICILINKVIIYPFDRFDAVGINFVRNSGRFPGFF